MIWIILYAVAGGALFGATITEELPRGAYEWFVAIVLAAVWPIAMAAALFQLLRGRDD